MKDFTLDGGGLRGQGINFSSGIDDPATQGNRIMLQNITVRNVFDHGMATSRVSNLIFDHVNLMYNGNDSGRTALWFICERFGNTPTRYTRDPQYAPQDVLINRCTVVGNTRGAVFKDVKRVRIVNSTFRSREADILTLRCADEVKIEDTSLSKPPGHFTAPEDVPIL